MTITGKYVKHKAFGTGTITDVRGGHIIVSFETGEKTFVFPDVFSAFLSVEDEELQTYILNLLEQQAAEKELLAEQKKLEQQKQIVEISYKPTKNKYKRANIAFKCNYCDGGKSNQQIGFDGVCSDAIIYNNIEVEKRTWCNSDDCACLHYLNEEITRNELDAMCSGDRFVCYESQMLRDWKALAGIVQTGERKNEPMKLHQVQRNSLCVLTTRIPGMKEHDRFIFAAFLVDETYEGDGKEEGYVSTNSKYKIKLAPHEAEKLLFWNYHANENKAETPAWSSGLHRYFEDDVAALILKDIVRLKEGTDDSELAKEFLQHFCKVNNIDISTLAEPIGALKRQVNSQNV